MRQALVLIGILTAAAIARADVSHPVAASVARGRIRRVIVDIPAGDIVVHNGPSDRIRVSGSVGRSCDDDCARESRIANDIGVEIFVDSEDALVRRKFGPQADGWRTRAWNTNYQLVVEVPAGVGVDLETKYGDLTIEGDFGNINADLRAGEIRLRTPRDSVKELNASVRVGEVHTDFGDDHEDHEGVLPGTTHFINAQGRTRINVHTTVGELHVVLTR